MLSESPCSRLCFWMITNWIVLLPRGGGRDRDRDRDRMWSFSWASTSFVGAARKRLSLLLPTPREEKERSLPWGKHWVKVEQWRTQQDRSFLDFEPDLAWISMFLPFYVHRYSSWQLQAHRQLWEGGLQPPPLSCLSKSILPLFASMLKWCQHAFEAEHLNVLNS